MTGKEKNLLLTMFYRSMKNALDENNDHNKRYEFYLMACGYSHAIFSCLPIGDGARENLLEFWESKQADYLKDFALNCFEKIGPEN